MLFYHFLMYRLMYIVYNCSLFQITNNPIIKAYINITYNIDNVKSIIKLRYPNFPNHLVFYEQRVQYMVLLTSSLYGCKLYLVFYYVLVFHLQLIVVYFYLAVLVFHELPINTSLDYLLSNILNL